MYRVLVPALVSLLLAGCSMADSSSLTAGFANSGQPTNSVPSSRIASNTPSAPGVSAPCPDGFAPGEVLAFARLAGREPRVRLLEVMELSPPHDPDGCTARLGAAAIWNFLAGLCERQVR